MVLSPGTRLGPYEIVSLVGSGGMGEVYKATDTRLNRTVAIKVLNSQLAGDPAFRERFDREAKTISQLDHPHICALFDVGEQDGIAFLVMQYLEGETLARRLERGALPLDQALSIALEIADALNKAHRAGIIHRDLKPGNILVTQSGAKLLDFGLAKVSNPVLAGSGLSMLPTTPPGLTAQGTILGTFQYMAPEQLEGQEADARTDIFAFGAVVYEMITGKKAFEGKSQASLIGAILKDSPPAVSTRQPLAPAALDRIIATCLAKDPTERWQAAHDLTLQLRWIDAWQASSAVAPPVARPRHREKLAWAAALIGLLTGVAAFAGRYFESTGPAIGAVRFAIDVPASPVVAPTAGFLAVSPDGRSIAFEAVSPSNNVRSLWVRPLDSNEAQPLRGTDDAQHPFWSPDSRFIGFFADGKLKTISISGGSARTLCDAATVGGGAWSRDGVILFGLGGGQGEPIYRVADSGGQPGAVTKLDKARNDTGHIRPHFLPDGRHFLFLINNADISRSGIHVGTLDSTDTRLVENVASSVAYVPPGYLLFARDGTLMARPFDASRQESFGEPVALGEVRQNVRSFTPSAAFSVSASGVLAYQPRVPSEAQLVWLTRDGKAVGGFAPRETVHAFWLAPDQQRAVVEQAGQLWLLDSTRGTASRFTTDERALHPVWSRDGRRIAFSSEARAALGVRSQLMLKLATGVAEAEPIVQTPTTKFFTDWSLDGRTLVFEEQNGDTGYDISVVPVDGDRTPHAVIRSRFQERMGTLSPDGRYLAYMSNETGRNEIYVVPFPDVSDKWPISTSGGAAPRWREDGSELFFVDAAGMLMSAPVTRGDRFAVGVPKPLFELQAVSTDGWNYAVSADGQRILVARLTEAAAPNRITVVVNWTALLQK